MAQRHDVVPTRDGFCSGDMTTRGKAWRGAHHYRACAAQRYLPLRLPCRPAGAVGDDGDARAGDLLPILLPTYPRAGVNLARRCRSLVNALLTFFIQTLLTIIWRLLLTDMGIWPSCPCCLSLASCPSLSTRLVLSIQHFCVQAWCDVEKHPILPPLPTFLLPSPSSFPSSFPSHATMLPFCTFGCFSLYLYLLACERVHYAQAWPAGRRHSSALACIMPASPQRSTQHGCLPSSPPLFSSLLALPLPTYAYLACHHACFLFCILCPRACLIACAHAAPVLFWLTFLA